MARDIKENDNYSSNNLIHSLIQEVERANLNQEGIYFQHNQYLKIIPSDIGLLWDALQKKKNLQKITIILLSGQFFARTECEIDQNILALDRESFNKALMKSPVFNPFLWQVKIHYSGLLHTVNHFSDEELTNNIILLEKEILRLTGLGFFKKYEQIVRDSIQDELLEHVTSVLAIRITNIKIPKYSDARIKEILEHMQKVIEEVFHDSQSEESKASSEQELDSVSFTLQSLKQVVNDLTVKTIEYYQSLIIHLDLAARGHATGVPERSKKDEVKKLLKKYLKIKLKISVEEGVYLTEEDIKIELHDIIKEKLSSKYKDQSELSTEDEQNIVQKADEICFDKDYKAMEITEKQRLDQYVGFLRARELETLKKQQMERYIFLIEQQQHEEDEIDDDPDSAEYDYDGPRYPSLPPFPMLPTGYYAHEMFDNLSDLKNLVTFSEGKDGLGWLVYQKVEHSFDIIKEVVDRIIKDDAISLELDLVEFILGSLVFDRDYSSESLFTDNFIAMAIIDSLKRLRNSSIEAAGGFLVPTKQDLIDKINKQFVLIQPLVEKEMFGKIMREYNKAYENLDYLTMQKTWAVFTRTQYWVNKGNYQERLQQEYQAYLKVQEEYYMRIYPGPNTSRLIYLANNPHKTAEFDLNTIFDELSRVGRNARDVFTKRDENDGTNLLTFTFCFLVSDKPHDPAINNHKRIFLPVQINFDGVTDSLISFDSNNVFFEKADTFKDKFIPRTDEERAFVILYTEKNNKALRSFIINVVTSLLRQVLEKPENNNKSSEQIFKEFIESTDFFRIFIDKINNNETFKNVISGFFNRKKLTPQMLNPENMPELVGKISDELAESFSKVFGLHYATLDHSRACETIQTNTGIDYKPLFHVAGEHPEDHSERVLFQLLKNPKHLKNIAETLKSQIQIKFNNGAPLAGKYKIYWMGLFLYSSNSECNNCTLSLIGLQNSRQDGFLRNLMDYLHNEVSNFKVRGYEKKQPDKFHLTTFVAFDKNLTEQAHHITGDEIIARHKKQLPNEHYNPHARLNFFAVAINVKKSNRSYNGDFFEFHYKNHKQKPEAKLESYFKYVGPVLMSGSKNKKFVNESKTVDAEIKNAIS